ncbi:MAG: TonB-dependent receptor [Bacteroidota bacterium]|nr:TonB-dependent receptor [Bacteroidota bacterium]
MRISLILISFFLTVQIITGQDLNRRISLNIHNQSFEKTLRLIEDKSGIRFSYNPKNIPIEKKVSIQAKQMPVYQVLDRLLKPLEIRYFVVESQIVLKPGEKEISEFPSVTQEIRKSFTINGYVKEKSSGEALIGANIHTKDNKTGTVTNTYGFFSLTLPEKDYSLVVSYVGYKDINRQIRLNKDYTLEIEMEESARDIKEIEIVGSRLESELKEQQSGIMALNSRSIQQMPAFAGNPDLIRSLQTLPGIRSYGDGSSLFYVRGGNNDQNLILVDEAPIYNPSHLFGFFSALSPDAINDVMIYKDNFPPKYGGRLSSVIDVTAKEGNDQHFGFSGNLSPYMSYASAEGPIWKNRSSFFISGRLSTLNWLNYFARSYGSFNLWFFDINAKMNLIANKNNRIFLTFYTGKDVFDRITESSYRTFGVSWNNLAGTLRWNHIFNHRLFSNTTLIYSKYHYYLFLSQEQKDYWNSMIADVSLKSDLTWYLNPRNTIRGGVKVNYRDIDPGNVHNSSNDVTDIPEVSQYHSIEYDIYLGNQQQLRKKLLLNYGVRVPYWQDLGPATLYFFDANHKVIDTVSKSALLNYSSFIAVEPRVSISFEFSPNSNIKAGYSRMTQFLQTVSNSTGPFTSLEIWIPSGPNIKPQKTDQYSLDFSHFFSKPGLVFSADAFYKNFMNHMDYKDHADLLYNPLLEGELRFGKAWSYGLEIMLRKPEGKLSGWISYTWSRSWVHTPEVNEGKNYPSNFDTPDNVCIHLAYDTRNRWMIAANWMYMTGMPVTTPIGFFYNNGYTIPVYGSRNNDRLPDYHRLDISVTYRFNKPESRFKHSLVVTLYNAYGRNNPFSVSFNKVMKDDGSFIVPSDMNGKDERVPTLISVAGIVPSINYQFKF